MPSAPPSAPDVSLPLFLLDIDVAPSLTSAAHVWFPVATSAFISPFSSCVRDFGGLFYCGPLCDVGLARCLEPVRKRSQTIQPGSREGTQVGPEGRCVKYFHVCEVHMLDVHVIF